MSKRILKNLAELIFVSVMFIVVAVLSVRGGLGIMADLAEMDTPPDAGPPAAQHDAIEGVWQEDFQEAGYDYAASRRLFLIELNRLRNEGCRVVGVTAAIGGAVALMECGGSDDAK